MTSSSAPTPSLFNREAGLPLPDGDQHVVLVNTVGFDADQLA